MKDTLCFKLFKACCYIYSIKKHESYYYPSLLLSGSFVSYINFIYINLGVLLFPYFLLDFAVFQIIISGLLVIFGATFFDNYFTKRREYIEPNVEISRRWIYVLVTFFSFVLMGLIMISYVSIFDSSDSKIERLLEFRDSPFKVLFKK